jgi:hypothetical protein
MTLHLSINKILKNFVALFLMALILSVPSLAQDSSSDTSQLSAELKKIKSAAEMNQDGSEELTATLKASEEALENLRKYQDRQEGYSEVLLGRENLPRSYEEQLNAMKAS